jgi:hypothetical protein
MYFARICEAKKHEHEILLTCRKFIVLYQCEIKTVVISAADTVELGELLKELGNAWTVLTPVINLCIGYSEIHKYSCRL